MEPVDSIEHRQTTRSDDQSEVVLFLESGAGYDAAVERIDTHGAMIFLVGQEALKIKRAVKYDYMDLSTVEKRRALLYREFELNRDAAPSIYRAVKPLVRKADGTVAMGSSGDSGEVLEWVLTMNRFPKEAELSHIAKHVGIGDDLAIGLGVSIARYHDAAPVKRLDAHALIKEILEELNRVFDTMHTTLGPDAARFLAVSRNALLDRTKRFKQRSLDGHVRRCHGDLHLRNIVMIDGVPTPFDALEFDERLGTCDTLYDLAFLLMDLDHLGMSRAANLVLNAYLGHAAPDLSQTGLSLLPLYLSLRAAIRAMVDVQLAAVSEADRERTPDAHAYLAQALDYLAPPPPVLVAIGGYSGTGKTTIARAIAHWIGASPGAIHIRSDVVRKALLRRDPLDHLGPEGYTPEITERTYAATRDQAGHILREGQAAILDAVHSDPDARAAAQAVATAAACGFIGIWLDSPTRTRLARVASRGPDASDADAAVVQAQSSADPGGITWHRVDADQPFQKVTGTISEILRASGFANARDRGDKNVG